MSEMQNFAVWMLGALTDFLMSPPVSYIVALILLCFACKAVKIIIS